MGSKVDEIKKKYGSANSNTGQWDSSNQSSKFLKRMEKSQDNLRDQ